MRRRRPAAHHVPVRPPLGMPPPAQSADGPRPPTWPLLRARCRIRRSEFDGYDPDELVVVTLTGAQAPVRTQITEEAMERGATELGDMLTAAYKDAHAKSLLATKERMQDLAKQLGLPPGMADKLGQPGGL